MRWHLTAVLAEVEGIRADELVDWIERGWLQPAGDKPDWVFVEYDIARVRLVRDLRHQAGIDDEHLALVLSLLQQLHQARASVQALLAVIQHQPEDVRKAILAELGPG